MALSGDQVRAQLDRLLASAGFANAGRMSRFLKFVVEQTLAGDAERLKEYVIGVEVFDRDEEYDPRVDAIVRVEAARLRTKLTEYYAGEGRDDPVVLSLPKGGYAAVLELREPPVPTPQRVVSPVRPDPTTEHAPVARVMRLRTATLGALLAGAITVAVAAWAPWNAPANGALRIAVLPFTPYSDDDAARMLAMQLTEGVTAELVRAGGFDVIASTSAREVRGASERVRDVAAALDADVVVEARVIPEGDRVRVEARAVSGDREEKFWVDSFAGPVDDIDALEREVAAAVGSALAAVPRRD